MPAHTLRMDAAINGSSPATRAQPVVAHLFWGVESPWVLAAIAAAPWPLWSVAALLGVPGAEHVPRLSHGVLAFAVVLAAMGVWTHRPSVRSSLRWSFAIIGTGLMGELLANALTDMGRAPGLGEASDASRGLVVWLLCLAVYEVAPIVAASARVSRTEERRWRIDAVAHAGFVLAAFGAYAWQPTWGTAWFVLPWLAVAVALPLAAARSGPDRDAELPTPHPRGGVLFGGAAIAWALLIAITIARTDAIQDSLHAMRWGITPSEGVMLALPAVSVFLSLLAAGVLLLRARAASENHCGVVAEHGDGGVVITMGDDSPTTVAIEAGLLPPLGSTVTLIGAAPRNPTSGPFRDGAKQLRARRLWAGQPGDLARSLSHRAGGWLAWSAVSALGVLLRVL